MYCMFHFLQEIKSTLFNTTLLLAHWGANVVAVLRVRSFGG